MLMRETSALDIQLMLIECLLGVGSFKQAMTMCNNLFSTNQSNIKLITLRGTSLYYTGNFANGKKHFQSVLRKDPDNRPAMLMFKKIRKLESLKAEGNTCFGEGKVQDAVDRFSQALDVDPANKLFNSQLYCNR